jgi:hypothetical protein
VILDAVLRRTSGHSMTDLHAQAREMPLYLLDRACYDNPTAATNADRIDRIRQSLIDNNDSRQLWRDSDVYYPIFTLFEARGDEAAVDRLLRRLEIQLGIRPVADLRTLSPAIYRLLSLTAQAWAANGDTVTPLHDVFTHVPECDATVYLPRRGLFHDVVPVERYPTPAQNESDEALLEKVRTACALLAAFDRRLYEDFQDLISTIVLVPSGRERDGVPFDSRRQTWSYNLRLRYFGGIFVDATHVDAHAVAEALLHEYLHQRLWQLWELEHPEGLPAPHVTITSPMTGVTRPAYVMVQALLIYVAAHALHRAAVGAGRRPPATPWVHARITQLSEGIPRLRTALRAVVPRGSRADGLLDVGAELFDGNERDHSRCALDASRGL